MTMMTMMMMMMVMTIALVNVAVERLQISLHIPKAQD
jgi:hypothetical protein